MNNNVEKYLGTSVTIWDEDGIMISGPTFIKTPTVPLYNGGHGSMKEIYDASDIIDDACVRGGSLVKQPSYMSSPFYKKYERDFEKNAVMIDQLRRFLEPVIKDLGITNLHLLKSAHGILIGKGKLGNSELADAIRSLKLDESLMYRPMMIIYRNIDDDVTNRVVTHTFNVSLKGFDDIKTEIIMQRIGCKPSWTKTKMELDRLDTAINLIKRTMLAETVNLRLIDNDINLKDLTRLISIANHLDVLHNNGRLIISSYLNSNNTAADIQFIGKDDSIHKAWVLDNYVFVLDYTVKNFITILFYDDKFLDFSSIKSIKEEDAVIICHQELDDDILEKVVSHVINIYSDIKTNAILHPEENQ